MGKGSGRLSSVLGVVLCWLTKLYLAWLVLSELNKPPLFIAILQKMKVFPETFREQFLCQHGKIVSLKWKINIYNLEKQTQTSYDVSDRVITIKQESYLTPDE